MEEHFHCGRCGRVITLKDLAKDHGQYVVTYTVTNGARHRTAVSHAFMCPKGGFDVESEWGEDTWGDAVKARMTGAPR